MNKTCAQSARQTQPLRVVAQPITTGKSLKIKLFMTNVSRRNQVFWVASGYCTNQRWKTNDPNIGIVDYCLKHTKTCMVACEHKVMLRPGETLDRVVSPLINRNTRPDRQSRHYHHPRRVANNMFGDLQAPCFVRRNRGILPAFLALRRGAAASYLFGGAEVIA